MNIVEYWAESHTGLVRRANEDALLATPPLFVVADGMGGARAGETAARIAVETFADATSDPDRPDAFVRATIELANRRIFERGASDVATAGMGTTTTAALVVDGRVVIGHVGDSRAYRLRDGVLTQVTHDHSLVGELVRRGAITQREAEVHPQRSVITRALGTEATVEVDTVVADAVDGDVYLLCSDGLTGMVGDAQVGRILRGVPRLEIAARELIRAANAAGGEDNISVVLFRLGGGPSALDADRPAIVAAAPRRIVIVDEPTGGGRRSGLRRVGSLLAVLAVAAALVAGASAFLGWAHFVGATAQGQVAVYQGVPFDLAGGVQLYRAERILPIPVAALTEQERRRLFDHSLLSAADAAARVASLAASAYWR
jgi:protein phosphatase